jgi:hypothetical protein
MEAARASWTDPRLDDLNDRVKSMDKKIDAGFARLDERIDGTNERIDKDEPHDAPGNGRPDQHHRGSPHGVPHHRGGPPLSRRGRLDTLCPWPTKS